MVDVAQVSFSKGEVSPIAAARTDEQFYTSALQKCTNFFVHPEGGVSNRPGTQFIYQTVSAKNGSYMVPFIYNNAQAYLVEFSSTPVPGYNGSINVYLNGALVQAGIGTPYLSTDLPNLRWAQSADTLNVTVQTQPLYQLKRLTPTSFSFTAPTLLFGPFQDLNTDGTTYVYASGTQGAVTITASNPIFQASHVGALFTIQEQFLGSIMPWTAQQVWVTGNAPVAGALCRSDNKIYVAVGPPGNGDTNSGNFQPVHTLGTQWDGNEGQIIGTPGFQQGIEWQFVSTNAGVAQITGFIDSKHVTAVVQSHKGIYSNFPPSVVGGPVAVHGPYNFTGDGSTTSFGPLTASTVVDPNQFFVTVGAVFQDPATYSISSVAGNIQFNQAPSNGAAVVVTQVTGTVKNIYANLAGGSNTPVPMAGLCLSTYWAFGSFSPVQGYPADCCYFDDRLTLASTTLQPQTLFTSRVSDYLNFGVSDPQVDSDGIVETINARQQNPINNLLPMNNLLLGTASASWRAVGSSALGAITPSDIALIPQEFFGMQNVPAVQTGTTIVYVQWGGRKIRDIQYNFYTDKFQGSELTLLARHMFPFGTTALRAAYAPEPYGLLYVVRSDGVLCVCTYMPQTQSFAPPEQQLIAWSTWNTAGNIEDVCVLPENNSFSVYVLVGRTIGGVYNRYIERFAPREYLSINDAFFVDSGLTYDGRNASTTTMTLTGGTTWLAQDTGTLTASSGSGWAGFAATDPGLNNAIWLNDAFGNRLCRLQLTAVLSSTVAKVLFLDPVPASAQGVPISTWTFARTNFTGLTNIRGQTASIMADGSVMPRQIVSSTGSVTLQNAGGVVHVGLPYASQLQSLNLNVQGQETIRNRAKSIPRVSFVVDQSYPFSAGPDFTHLNPVQQRQFETYTAPITPHTGVLPADLQTLSTDDAYVCAEMDDPAPVRILSWIADVDVGEAQ